MRLQHGTFGVIFVLGLVMLASIFLPVSAQTTDTATPPSVWDTTQTEAPLTLIWQTTFTPETALLTPGDIAIDSDGNVYVSTQSSNTVKKFDSWGKLVTEWGGGGKDDGKFSLTLGIDVDSDNNVYVADFYHKRIQKFDSAGKFLLQWATEPTTSPAFLAIDPHDNIYIDQFPLRAGHYMATFDSWGKLVSALGNEDKHFGNRLEDIAIDAAGNIYVADPLMHRIQKIDANGSLLATFGGENSTEGNGLFEDPFGITVDNDGYIYVLDSNFLQKLDWQGNCVAQWSTAGGDLDRATNVAVDHEGNIYVFAHTDAVAGNGNTVNVLVLKKFQQAAS